MLEFGCPARIRTSINGVRVRSLTFRRRGNEERDLVVAPVAVKAATRACRLVQRGTGRAIERLRPRVAARSMVGKSRRAQLPVEEGTG